MKAKGPTLDRYISGYTINDYLYDLAENNNLIGAIRLQKKAQSIKKQGTKASNWLLIVDNSGQEPLIETTKLVVACGPISSAYMPDIPQSTFKKPIIHSARIGTSMSDFKLPSMQRVVVLGAAKSAYDIVFLMLKQWKKVDWVVRADGMGPLSIMPPRNYAPTAIRLPQHCRFSVNARFRLVQSCNSADRGLGLLCAAKIMGRETVHPTSLENGDIPRRT